MQNGNGVLEQYELDVINKYGRKVQLIRINNEK